jgi:cell division protein FtsB
MAGNQEMSSNGFDPMAQYARLSERVENQGKDIVDLRSNMNTGFQTVNAAIGTLSNELRSNSKTQWPVIWAAAGVCFTVLATGGAFFYNSLSKGQDRLDSAVNKNAELTQSALTAVVDKMVTQKEMEWRTNRGAEDRARMESSIKEVRDAQVPRAELERVWQSQDQTTAQLQKQIDELKSNSASVYTPRDVLLDNRERIDRLERQRLSPSG